MAFDKQFQQSLLVETKFFLINFSRFLSVCGWLRNQQTICLSVNYPSIVPALVLALYGEILLRFFFLFDYDVCYGIKIFL